jgi:hypothetical protein
VGLLALAEAVHIAVEMAKLDAVVVWASEAAHAAVVVARLPEKQMSVRQQQ